MKNQYDKEKESLAAKYAAELAELEAKGAVYKMIPEGDNVIVCNFRTPSPFDPRAWISYSSPSYDPDEVFDPVQILRGLEARGWTLSPVASLVKWDHYRHAMENSSVETIKELAHPESLNPARYAGQYKFKEGFDVAPYWVVPNQYTRPDFVAYMVGPDGLTYQVSVDCSRIPVAICGSRVNLGSIGAWKYVACSIRYPQDWKTHSLTRGYVDTEHGISGAVYFTKADAKPTASEALAFMLPAKQKKRAGVSLPLSV